MQNHDDADGSKRIVLMRTLDGLFRGISPSKARVATLGGKGIEAGIWDKAGIRGLHGWLIERDPVQLANLREAYGHFRITDSLVRFAETIRKRLGPRAYLDLFHLDLCGTIEPNILKLARVLPLLMNGRQRLLALTMADSRRNRSLEHADVTNECGSLLFGAIWPELCDRLLTLHANEPTGACGSYADPINVTTREIGFFINLAFALASMVPTSFGFGTGPRAAPVGSLVHALCSGKVDRELRRSIRHESTYVVPVRLERYVYWSDNRMKRDGRPSRFRMRTYILRLDAVDEPISLVMAARKMARLLMRSTYSIVDNGTIRTMSLQDVRKRPLDAEADSCLDARIRTEPFRQSSDHAVQEHKDPDKETNMGGASVSEIRSYFAGILPALSAAHQEHFNRLCELAASGENGSTELNRRIALAISTLQGGKGKPEEGKTQAASAAPVASASPPKSVPKTPPKEEPTPRKKRTKKHYNLSLDEADDLRLELIRANHEGPQAFQKAEKAIAKKLPSNGKKTRMLGGLRAHANGTFRPNFMARTYLRTEEAKRSALMEELSKIYAVPVKELMGELTGSATYKSAQQS
jgi:hypothetical protein